MSSPCVTRSASHRLRLAAPLTAAFAALAVASPVRADIIDIAWDASGRFERTVTVAPGKFAELCGKLPAGLKVRWDFEASAPLDFNVHYHVGKDVVFPSKMAATRKAKDVLDTRIEQDYCWMWSNKTSAAASLKVELQR